MIKFMISEEMIVVGIPERIGMGTVPHVAIHILKRVAGIDDEGRGGEVPFERVEFGGEGIGEDEVVVDELTIRATRAIGDAPTESLGRTGEDLRDAFAVLKADFIGVAMVTETAGLDDGEETPAKLGFFRLGEFDRDDTGREGTVEQGPEAFADAGGIDDDVLGLPGFGEAFELAKDGQVVFADPTVTGDDMVGGMAEVSKGGEVDPDDGEGGGIAAGIAEAEVGGMEGGEVGLVHAGDVEEEGNRTPGPSPTGSPSPPRGEQRVGERRREFDRMEEGEAGGGEHAGLGVEGFAEVLGADTRVVAAMLGDDPVDMQAVGGDELTDIVGVELEEALDAILFLGLQGDAALALEQGIGEPGDAAEDAGGIGAGGHGVEVPVELGDRNGLGLIDRHEKVGGGAEDIGTGSAGEELQAGLAELVDVALGGLPEVAGADTVIEGPGDADHVELGLGLEGGGDGDDAAAGAGIAKEQPGEDVGLELVLAGLARQDDDEGEAALVEDGILDGAGNRDLIGTQVDAAGERPGDGGAADGGADGLGEEGGVRTFLILDPDRNSQIR